MKFCIDCGSVGIPIRSMRQFQRNNRRLWKKKKLCAQLAFSNELRLGLIDGDMKRREVGCGQRCFFCEEPIYGLVFHNTRGEQTHWVCVSET